MSEVRKKPVWPWIVGVLVVVPVLYVLSFGPACWLGSRELTQPWGSRGVFIVYDSVLPELAMLAPGDTGCRAILWYARLFGEDAEMLAIFAIGSAIPREFT